MFRCTVRGTVCANFVDSSGGDAVNLDVLSVCGRAAGGIWRLDRRLKKPARGLRVCLSPHGLSVVFTPMLVELRANQYTSAGLAKRCQP